MAALTITHDVKAEPDNVQQSPACWLSVGLVAIVALFSQCLTLMGPAKRKLICAACYEFRCKETFVLRFSRILTQCNQLGTLAASKGFSWFAVVQRTRCEEMSITGLAMLQMPMWCLEAKWIYECCPG
jgi:hypothetical protein